MPLVRQELIDAGYQVKTFEDKYITRDNRLSIQKIVLCTGFEIKKTVVKEGSCCDMKMTLVVMNNPAQNEKSEYEVLGRSLMVRGKRSQWGDIYRECVGNLLKVPGLRKSLEIDTSE